MTSSSIVSGEGVAMTDLDHRGPKHISEFMAEALKEMTEANMAEQQPTSVTTYDHVIPCPPWCIFPDGHPFSMVGEDGIQIRYHEPKDYGLKSLGPYWLSCEEQMDPGARQSTVTVGELMICVEQHLMGDDGRMTITEARLTARALNIAADIATAALGSRR